MAKPQNLQTKIGLEIHIELNTKTKMFCRCPNKSGGNPNEFICPVCLGYPGVLPMPNKKAVLYTLKLGLALNCDIPRESKFDRKHYFYPDLPKNYQISQYDMPLAKDGYLKIGDKKVGIDRVHLEEDAGKLIHPQGADYSLVDFNRSGVPLVEVVTGPDLTSPKEAKMFLKDLQLIVRYLGVSEADMEKGQLRCDANISVYSGSKTTPIFEIKNMNSFRAVENALSYEEQRLKRDFSKLAQVKGKRTLTWLESHQRTEEMRFKEEASDYRYFPEPDIPLMRPRKVFDLSALKKELPSLPAERREILKSKYKLSSKEIEVLVKKQDWYDYFMKVAPRTDPRLAADWMINENLGTDVAPRDFILLISELQRDKITRPFIKQTIMPALKKGQRLSRVLKQAKTSFDLEEVVKKVVATNQDAVANYKKGKTQALQFLVGQVMRETRGQADPGKVAGLLRKMI